MLLTSKEANLFHNREVIKIMRRMYSEQELSIIIHDVVGDYIEEGAFDESIASAVDAYLEENPVDITALEGQDVELNSLDATGLVTGGEIVEKMSGYSFIKSSSQGQYYDLSYVGVCKNGNKITFVVAGKMNFPNNTDIYGIGNFTIPTEVGAKLYPITGNQLAFLSVNAQVNYASRIVVSGIFGKNSNTNIDVRIYAGGLTAETDYYFRIEQTFLLSENLAPQE